MQHLRHINLVSSVVAQAGVMINRQFTYQAHLVIIPSLIAGCMQLSLMCAVSWAAASYSSASAAAVQANLRASSALQLVAAFLTTASAITLYLVIRRLELRTDGKEPQLAAVPCLAVQQCSVPCDTADGGCLLQTKLLENQQFDVMQQCPCVAACTATCNNRELMHQHHEQQQQQQHEQHISIPLRVASASAAAGHLQTSQPYIAAPCSSSTPCTNSKKVLQQQQQSAAVIAGIVQEQHHVINATDFISQLQHNDPHSRKSNAVTGISTYTAAFAPTGLVTYHSGGSYLPPKSPSITVQQQACSICTHTALAHPIAPMVDVWILAGQSNCVGWNQADGQVMPDVAAPWPGNILAYNAKDGLWQDAAPNVHFGVYDYQDANSCGPDMAFARTLVLHGITEKVGLVPTAMGGTSLYEHWREDGRLWTNMVQQAAAAVDRLGKHGRLKGMIWIQGEADGGSTMQHAFDYGKNFTSFLDATRSALSRYCPKLPVVMAVMATRQRDAAFPYIDIVAAQQRALQLPEVFKVEMTGFEFYATAVGVPGEVAQLVHLTKAGCCALGAAMANVVALAGSGTGSCEFSQ